MLHQLDFPLVHVSKILFSCGWRRECSRLAKLVEDVASIRGVEIVMIITVSSLAGAYTGSSVGVL